ncbi:hypothetical protein M433DRAFT_84226 [Acidomyces richmondensis BFW]|nr:MAG: hypothetical protein FE78DRAFT_27519 [Acidomyces sp. 'richmondensis']KYG48248.1 hypothetical protein M433DRAFT_84226 [Acidomyces richmondensis BFW]
MSVSGILLHFLPQFFYNQLFVTPPYPSTDCSGKTIIVTGANTGLGKEAARHFVRLNADKVILGCRSLDKGTAARQDIEATTNRRGIVEVWQLDLQDYESVKCFAEKAKSLERLDSVVENAGIFTTTFRLAEGNESTITVNVVSTFLLALLLMPTLQQSAEKYDITPTLTIVSSELHFVTSFPESKSSSIFDSLNDEKTARMADRYNVSKLIEVLSCRQIAQEHPVSQLKFTLNFVNPGWCHSDLGREHENAAFLFMRKLLGRTTEVGSRTLVHAGLSGPQTHGKYLSDCKITRCAPLVEGTKGPELQRQVWNQLAEKLNCIEPGITKVLDA